MGDHVRRKSKERNHSATSVQATHLAQRQEVVEKKGSVHLDVDDLALLLIGQLVQVHDDKTTRVAPQRHTFRSGGDEHSIARWHQILVNKSLDLITQASSFIDAVDQHDQSPHLKRLDQHLPPRFHLLACVACFDVELQQTTRVTFADQEDYALNIHHDGHESNSVSRVCFELISQGEHRLLGHPSLARARPSADKHRLSRVHAV